MMADQRFRHEGIAAGSRDQHVKIEIRALEQFLVEIGLIHRAQDVH